MIVDVGNSQYILQCSNKLVFHTKSIQFTAASVTYFSGWMSSVKEPFLWFGQCFHGNSYSLLCGRWCWLRVRWLGCVGSALVHLSDAFALTYFWRRPTDL